MPPDCAVADRLEWWDAETVTARCANTEPTGCRMGRRLILADVTRLEHDSSKDRYSARVLQVGRCGTAGDFVCSDGGIVRSQRRAEMDERPLHELSFDDVYGTDRWPAWRDMNREANLVFMDAEKTMRRWEFGPLLRTEEEKRGETPFVGRFADEQLRRIWPFLVQRMDETLDGMREHYEYTDEQVERERAKYELMLRLMWDGRRAGDAEAPAYPVAMPPPRAVDRSESPIEKMLVAELRWSGRVCDDPGRIKEDCEREDRKRGVFIYQQAAVLNYRTDFLLGAMSSPDAKPHWVVVECDGHEFHERTPEQAEHDRARDRAMTAAGYHVFRFTGREIRRDARRCAREVMRYLRPFTGPAK